MRRTRDQKCFNNLGNGSNGHELMIPQRTMKPSIARVNEQLDPRIAASRQSATLGLHPVAHKLLLISRPTEGRRLSWAHSMLATCSRLLANDRQSESNRNLSYESTPTTRPHAPTQVRKCEQLAQSCYLVVHRLGIEPWTYQSHIQRPNRWATKPVKEVVRR